MCGSITGNTIEQIRMTQTWTYDILKVREIKAEGNILLRDFVFDFWGQFDSCCLF